MRRSEHTHRPSSPCSAFHGGNIAIDIGPSFGQSIHHVFVLEASETATHQLSLSPKAVSCLGTSQPEGFAFFLAP